MNGWDKNLESDYVLTNAVDACIEALETGQAQICMDMLKILRMHVKANNEKIKEARASVPYIRALGKIRRRAADSGTESQHGKAFTEGLLCAANMLEKQYRKDQ